jgi:MFS family permease
MIKIILPVAALLISVALLQTGNGIQGTLLPIRASVESFSTLSIALLGSTYFLGFIGGCLYGPKLVSLVGHIRVFTAMVALASTTSLIHGLIAEPVIWWLLRVTTGFSFAVLYVVIESWLNESATKDTRGTIFAIYLVINMTLMTLGQLLLLVFDIKGFELFAITSILISLAAMPVALSNTQAPKISPRIETNLKKIYRISPVGFIGCLSAGAASGSFWALAPKYASLAGFDVAGIALFMSITLMSGAVGQVPIGMLSDRFDRRLVMVIVSGLSAITSIAIVLLAGSDSVNPYVLAGLWGFFTFPIYGLAVAHANDFARPDQFVEVSSGLLLIYAFGAIAGPVAAAQLMTGVSAASLFGFNAAVQLLLIGFILWRSTKRDSAPLEDYVRYIDALAAANSASTVMDESIQHGLVESDAATELDNEQPSTNKIK